MFNKLAKLSIAMTFGEMTLRVVRFIVFIFLAKLYSPDLFGIFNYATNFLLIFYIIGELGINQFISTEQAKSNNFPDRFLLELGLAKQLFVLTAVLFGLLILCIINNFTMDRITVAAALLILADSNLAFVFAFFRSKHLVKSELKYKILQVFIYLIPCAIVYFINITFYNFIFILGIFNIFLSLFALRFLIQKSILKIEQLQLKLIVQLKTHIHSILPMFLTSIFTTIYFKVDIILIEHILGSFSNGIYSIVYKLLEAAMIMPWMVSIILMPLIARQEINFFVNIVIQLLIGCLVCFVLYLSSSYFILSFLPIEYAVAVDLIKITAFSMIFMSLNSFLFTYTVSNKKLWANTTISFAMMIFNICANYYFLPLYGLEAASYITIFTELIGTVLVLLYIIYLKLKRQ